MSKRYPSRPKKPNTNPPKDRKGNGSGFLENLFGPSLNQLAQALDQYTAQQNSLINPLRPADQLGPNNQGFGGVNDLGTGFGEASNGTAYHNPNLEYDSFANTNLNLGNAAWQLHHGGNMLDFIAALNANNALTEANLPYYLQALLQYGATVDQRTYDQMATKDQRAYDQKVLQDQREYDWNLTQDQRSYDRSVLEDQRKYDSPTNQLARLMGAGISRDAALQMLSGGSPGSSGSSGSPVVSGGLGSGSPFAGSAPSIGASGGSEDPINKVFGAINAVSQLVASGVDVASAVASIKGQQYSNTMNQYQLDAFNSVNDVSSALNNAVVQGVLSQDDLQSFRNADDVYKYVLDHQDTNAFKGLFNSKSFQRAFGTTIGRQMFNKHWQEVRDSKDAGTLFDNFVRQQEAASRLANFNADKAYYDVQYAIGELSRQDVEIQNLWNDVWQGNINIEIAGKQLESIGYSVNQEKTYNDIFNSVYNGSKNVETIDTRGLGKGAAYLAFSEFDELSRMFQRGFALSGTSERQEAWEKFYLQNAEAARLMAGIKLQMTQVQSSAMNPNLNPNLSALISLYQIGNLTGAFDVLKFGAEVGSRLYLGRHNKNFVE